MQHEHTHHETRPSPTSVKDPVCGMTVDPAKRRRQRRCTAGKTYYFCSARCREQVRRRSGALPSPRTGRASAGGRAPTGADYDLPDAPRDRPATSRALPDLRHGARAARPPTLDEDRTPSCVDMTRRFWVSAALTLPVARARDGRDAARAARCSTRSPRGCSSGCSSCSPRRSSCGAAGRSSSAAGSRS